MEQKNDNSKKVKLLCSYGGKIQSRPNNYQLYYVGGDTKILAFYRSAKLSEIVAKLNSLSKINDGGEIYVKYQLPGEDLDSLVSLIDDEDVEQMMVEYECMQRISAKPPRIRIFVFDISVNPVAAEPGSATNPDYLFGFDEEYVPSFGDVLQIQGMILPENGHCFYNNGAAVYGVNQTGAYINGDRTQPEYNIVPMMQPISMMNNSIGVNVNRPNF